MDEDTPEPRYEDYPTHAAYLLAWYTWRALCRDGRLTDAELGARFAVFEERLAAQNRSGEAHNVC